MQQPTTQPTRTVDIREVANSGTLGGAASFFNGYAIAPAMGGWIACRGNDAELFDERGQAEAYAKNAPAMSPRHEDGLRKWQPGDEPCFCVRRNSREWSRMVLAGVAAAATNLGVADRNCTNCEGTGIK